MGVLDKQDVGSNGVHTMVDASVPSGTELAAEFSMQS